MRVTRAFDSAIRRKVLLASLASLTLGGIVIAWLAVGSWPAILIAMVGVITLVATKALMELHGNQKIHCAGVDARLRSMEHMVSDRVKAIEDGISRQSVSIEVVESAVVRQSVSIEALRIRQEALNEKVLDRVRGVERASGQLEALNEKVLDRVRGVERASGQLEALNEKVLDRVRGVERASGQLEALNEKVLDRVRGVERASGQLEALNEKVLDRVRGVERASGQLEALNEKVLDRVRGVELRCAHLEQSREDARVPRHQGVGTRGELALLPAFRALRQRLETDG